MYVCTRGCVFKSGREREALVIADLGYECVYICCNIFFG